MQTSNARAMSPVSELSVALIFIPTAPVLMYLMQKVKGCLHKKISGQVICSKQSV